MALNWDYEAELEETIGQRNQLRDRIFSKGVSTELIQLIADPSKNN
jgi:hypothetical protein